MVARLAPDTAGARPPGRRPAAASRSGPHCGPLLRPAFILLRVLMCVLCVVRKSVIRYYVWALRRCRRRGARAEILH